MKSFALSLAFIVSFTATWKWPITLTGQLQTDVNNTMSQSEFVANTCNWRQGRENVCGQTRLVLVWILIG